jgi:hypothetical protein
VAGTTPVGVPVSATAAPEPVCRRAAEIRPADVLVIRGYGACAVREVRQLPGGELLIVLAWDRLALIAAPDSEWVTVPGSLPGRELLTRRDRPCGRCGGRGYV